MPVKVTGAERIRRPLVDGHVQIDGARVLVAGLPVQTDVRLEVALVAQEVEHARAFLLQRGGALGAGRRQRPPRADGDAPLDLVLADRPVARDEHVADAVVGEELDDQGDAAAARGALRDGRAVADVVQRLGQPRDRAERLADAIAGTRLDERVADRGDRLQQRHQLVVRIDALPGQLVAGDRNARGRGRRRAAVGRRPFGGGHFGPAQLGHRARGRCPAVGRRLRRGSFRLRGSRARDQKRQQDETG